jgi:hypothetical protein
LDQPTHKGICPLCREAIKADAIKCKHCGAWLGAAGTSGTDDDCGCSGRKRRGVDPASLRVLDVEPGSIPETGIAEAPQSQGCTGCQDGPGLIFNGRWTHRAGKRTCSVLVPIRVSPNGVVTWKRIEWTEDCLGTLVNDPWA